MIIMANSSSELTMQDCKALNTHSMILKSFGDKLLHNHHGYDQTQNLQDFLSRLEEERLKIDAFKRELPLCMQLLTNAVEASRQQLQACRATEEPRPVLEEFIPLKTSSSETPDKSQNMLIDKANWMTSAQLWSQNETKPLSIITTSSKETDLGFDVSPKLALHTKQRSGGAFLPFSKERNTTNTVIRSLPDLALASPDHNNNNNDMEDQNKCFEFENVRREDSGKVHNINGGVGIEQGKASGNSSDGQTTNNNATNSSTTTNQSHRKARRCWSPDLHRRFVNALQMLGGSQVATPKQIRELMKVEGLTNDEVKSHLQKYRLHTRRPSPSPQVTGGPAPQLVVLGGIWVPPEYATAAHGGGPTLYGSHHHHHHPSAPQTHFCAPQAVPQEFYGGTVAQPQQIHHQHQHALHHQLQMYKVTPQQNHSSPESDLRGAGDRSESIEDGKSESSSWKGDSGGENGNCGERRGLAALREDGGESNGSEITLKF